MALKWIFDQNDDEAELLSVLIEDIDNFDALIINPAGHSQASSIGLDTYSAVINKITNQGKPVVEVRIENILSKVIISRYRDQKVEWDLSVGLACIVMYSLLRQLTKN